MMRTRRSKLWVSALATTPLLVTGVAHACVRVAPAPREQFEVDTSKSALDTMPPEGVREVAASVSRSASTLCSGGTCTSVDCAIPGSVTLHYAVDTEDEPDGVGIRVSLVEGQLPESMSPMLDIVHPASSALTFHAGFDEITHLDAVVTLTVVDRAGNESAPSDPLSLRWSGCTTTFFTDGCLDEDRFECSDNGCTEVENGLLGSCTVHAARRQQGGPMGLLVAFGGLAGVAMRRLRGRRRARAALGD